MNRPRIKRRPGRPGQQRWVFRPPTLEFRKVHRGTLMKALLEEAEVGTSECRLYASLLAKAILKDKDSASDRLRRIYLPQLRKLEVE